MKKITINIPTSLSEWGNKFWYLFHPRRMKHNYGVMNDSANKICNLIRSNYWVNDISKEMKESVCKEVFSILMTNKTKLK